MAMATSKSLAVSISSRLCRTLFSTHKPFSKSFYSTGPDYNSDLDELPLLDSDPTESPLLDSDPTESPVEHSTESGSSERKFNEMPRTVLEGGLDLGIYKAIIVGQVGQNPVQKKLKNGKTLTLTTVGTGGIRNERIPFPTEEPKEYANRFNVQWHRVSVYPDRLGEIIMKHAQPGALLYLEGNLETKIFTDPITGIVKRIREIAIRRNGRIVFLGNGSDFSQPAANELKGVGYF